VSVGAYDYGTYCGSSMSVAWIYIFAYGGYGKPNSVKTKIK
jgi:hypothetical protein